MKRCMIVMLMAVACGMQGSAAQLRVYMQAGSAMAPLRYVAEWADATLSVDSQGKGVIVACNDTRVLLKEGKREVSILDTEKAPVTLAVAPRNVNGVLHVPASFFRDALGIPLSWNADLKYLKYTHPKLLGNTLILPVLAKGMFISEMQLDILNLRDTSISARITAGAKATERDSHGMTALHYAAFMRLSKAITTLLEHGADVNARGYNDQAPLHGIMGLGSPYYELRKAALDAVGLLGLMRFGTIDETAQLLLDHGANINARRDDGKTALHIAVNVDNADAVRLLLAQNADIESRDGRGCTPLHEAASYGHTEVMALLAEEKALIDARDADGWTPLHFAAEFGQEAAVKWLLAHGADVNAKSAESDLNISSLELFATVHYSIPCGRMTPLHIAVLRCAPTLSADQKSLDNSRIAPSLAIARHLLNTGKADAGIQAFGGATPLHYAVGRKIAPNTDLIRLLLAHMSAQAVNIRTEKGSTALEMALDNKHEEAAILIEKAGREL